MRYRCAVLDDYQNVALRMADWSGVAKDVDVTVFNKGLGGMTRSRAPCRASALSA